MRAGDHDWRQQALCLIGDPELFFPVGNGGPDLIRIEQARQVCRRCPVRDACLEFALDAGVSDGVWGGLSAEERRALQRERRASERQPAAVPRRRNV